MPVLGSDTAGRIRAFSVGVLDGRPLMKAKAKRVVQHAVRVTPLLAGSAVLALPIFAVPIYRRTGARLSGNLHALERLNGFRADAPDIEGLPRLAMS